MSTAPRIDELRKKFDENPRRYFAPLANELRKAGDLEQAIALCREHLPKQPGHMSGHIVFGQALFEHGDLEEARGVFEQALALDPENLIALRHLGDIARRQGDAPSARRWYERVLEADPRNDDIAAQLATLAATPTPPASATPQAGVPFTIPAPSLTPISLTPIDSAVVPSTPAVPTPVVPTPVVPTPVVSAHVDSSESLLDELPPLSPLQSADALATGGQDAGMFIDFDAMTATPAEASVAELPVELHPDEIGQDVAETGAETGAESVAADPFFDRVADAPTDDVIAAAEAEAEAAEAEAAFEEGFVAAEWPDTSDIAARSATPRASTPLGVDIPADVVEAFGQEPTDPVMAELPEPEVDVALADDELVAPIAPIASLHSDIQVGNSILDFEDESVDEVHQYVVASVAEIQPDVELPVVTEPDAVADDVADAAADLAAETVDLEAATEVEAESDISAEEPSPELPWLAAPVTPTDEVEEIVEAFAEDARAKGEADDVAVVAMPAPLVVDAHDAMESSFADVLDGDVEDDSVTDSANESVHATEAAGATFVTETMGELLVSQGFLDRAIAVYEELVRRRPFDSGPLGRLAELRAEHARRSAAAVRTAGAWFAELAARRVARRTPTSTAAVPTPRSGTPVHVTPVGSIPAEDSLASLFGADASTTDDSAAQQFATAFSGAEVEGARENLFASGAMAAVREPTPVASIAAVQPTAATGAGFSFDRFFPDPATSAQPASPHAASDAPTPAAPGTPTSSPAAEGKAADDLAQFSAWLKGLGNP